MPPRSPPSYYDVRDVARAQVAALFPPSPRVEGSGGASCGNNIRIEREIADS